MKKLLLVLSVTLFVCSVDAEYLRGGFNGWDTSYEMAVVDGFYSYTFQYSGSTGTVMFKIDQNGDWTKSWGGNVTAAANDSIGKLTDGWGDASIDLVDTKFYTFKLGGESNWTDRTLIVFQTDAAPSTIVVVEDDSVSATSALTVSVTMSDNVTQDTVYVRYTLDNWSTSSIIKADKMSDKIYNATLSGIPAESSISYYVMTSTFSKKTLESDPDTYFLTREINGGDNYSYTAPTATVVNANKSLDAKVFTNDKHIRIDFNSTNEEEVNISVVNLAGQNLYWDNVKISSGKNRFILPQTFNDGLYIVNLETQNIRFTKKIVIR